MMNGRGKSDSPIVPVKPPNRAPERAAEVVEGRGLTKGNPLGQNASRALSRTGAPSALERIRQAAQEEGWQRFVCQPYPWDRFGVLTQGRSPVR
ncbi:MAG: hypothetical protein ABIH46_04885 [Chloroflexota bacterium]